MSKQTNQKINFKDLNSKQRFVKALQLIMKDFKKGTPLDKESLKIAKEEWPLWLEEEKLQEFNLHILFPLSEEFDLLHVKIFIEILNHVYFDGPTDLKSYPDVVCTQAEVIDHHFELDSEGVSFWIVYQYFDENKKSYKFKLSHDYDERHIGYLGWSTELLKDFWKRGKKVKIRFLKSNPSLHAIVQPLDEDDSLIHCFVESTQIKRRKLPQPV